MDRSARPNGPEIHLFGRFRVTAPDGRDVTPKAVKSQALMALLACAADHHCTRVWLQDKLWSDRARAQGSASLRQALVDIRRSLGPLAPHLNADRIKIGLTGISLAPANGCATFLEGLDVRDAEFEDWLRLERQHRDATRQVPPEATQLSRPPERVSVLLQATPCSDPALDVVASFFADCAARNLRESFQVNVLSRAPTRSDPGQVAVRIDAFFAPHQRIGLRVRAEGDDRILWSGLKTVMTRGAIPLDDLDILNLSNQLTHAIADHILARGDRCGDRADATVLSVAALRNLFSMDAANLLRAEDQLKRATEIDPRGVFHAWRAQLRGIQVVERHPVDAKAAAEEGERLTRQALLCDPGNSMVLAAAANARLILQKDLMASLEMSRRSVEANAANPFGWWARSAARLYTGEVEKSYRAAMQAHRLSAGSPYRFWWDLQCALSAAAAGRLDEALIAAERCAALAPNFRPPRRYLTALYARRGAEDAARRWARSLGELEPDFTPARIADDETYPVSLLRKYNLLAPERLRALCP